MPRKTLHEVVEHAASSLPVTVTGAKWAAESLTIWGDGWSFTTMSSWRLLAQGRFVCSCFHVPDSASTHLVGKQLDRVGVRAGASVDDMTLVFDGVVVEVFTDMAVEPWVLSLGGRTYVPSSVQD